MATRDSGQSPVPPETKEFLRLLTLYDQQIFAYILLLVPNFSDAEEIAQEVRVKLWQQFAGKFAPGTDFGAWARSVAYYQILTHRRTSQRQPVGFGQKLLESLAGEFQPTAADISLRRDALTECLEKLSEPVREMVRRHYAGESWEQVAERMQRSAAAVRKAVYRARRTLTSCVARVLRREA